MMKQLFVLAFVLSSACTSFTPRFDAEERVVLGQAQVIGETIFKVRNHFGWELSEVCPTRIVYQ